MKLTIEDIRNPARKSGFNYVNEATGGGEANRTTRWRANFGVSGNRGDSNIGLRGPTRLTPLEAAQDYCDHRNGRGAAAPATLASAGHEFSVRRIGRSPEELHALGVLRDARAKREGVQGYVYLIIEVNPGGGLQYGKVGHSTNPKKRVAELQTGNPRPLALHCMKRGTEADEKALHRKYITRNVLQEWFSITKELLLEFDLDANGVPFAKEAAA